MKIVGFIPARYASTRFPGKPLAIIGGKPMIQRVYEQAMKSKSLSEVYVATDDVRIADAVSDFGGKFLMTKASHLSGTDRCAEALGMVKGVFDGVINIQGDEPYILPEQIDLLARTLDDPTVEIATLIKKIIKSEDLFNVNTPKVVMGANGQALFFSRQAIPFVKGMDVSEWTTHHTFYKHIGIYGYKAEVLTQLTRLSPSSLEIAESLEQLRWLENGFKIFAGITDFETIAIDHPEDLDKLADHLKTQ
jgi:3-deoxy-manno-octulosonate cytidylyltransferase (CMP-KDO synthetase)